MVIIKFTTTLKKNIYMYFGPKNAPECTSKHAKFQNHLGEASQTPQQEGETPSHTLPPAYQSLTRRTYAPAT